jgi:hypothetical protein
MSPGRDHGVPAEQRSRGAEDAQRRQEFDQWVLGIVPQLMRDIQDEVERCGVEFRARTGAQFTVKGRDASKATNPKAPWLGYFTLSLGNTQLHIYATRGGGTRLSVHMIPDDTGWAPKNERVVSQAGCLVVRKGDAYELRYLRGDPDGGPKDVIAMRKLVDRAFALLIESHVSGP